MTNRDVGLEPASFNIEDATKENRNFRSVAWSGRFVQVTLMSIPVGGDIGLEAHPQLRHPNDITLALAQRQLPRSEHLQASGFATRAALAETRVARDVAEAPMQAARIQLASNLPDGTDGALAPAVLTAARASLRAAHSRLDHATIAPLVAGTLIARRVQRGNVVQANTPLMTFAEWVEVFGDVKITTPLLNRITHHCDDLETGSDSFRFKQREKQPKPPREVGSTPT